MAENGTIEDINLELQPHLIPEKNFTSDNFNLLSEDTLALPSGAGSWKKHGREMGWGIKDRDGRRFIKRSFVFHRKNKRGKDTKTNWTMDVYARIDAFDFINTAKCRCHVFQCNNYDPRPLQQSTVNTAQLEEIDKFLLETATGKKRKASVWSRFTRVSASSSPAGEVLELSICNHCGMVYRTSSGTGTLGNHKCNDD